MITDNTYPFYLPALPYPCNTLEPFLDRETVHLHHDVHFQSYINLLNQALQNFPEYHSWSLTKLLTNLTSLPAPLQTTVRHNGGGAFSHDLYFDLLAPPGQEIPFKLFDYFDSDLHFFSEMKAAALGHFGSGSAWLVVKPDHSLSVLALENQDNPLTLGFYPILCLDVWEHAYYLKYRNHRERYIESWFYIINWEAVLTRLTSFFFS